MWEPQRILGHETAVNHPFPLKRLVSLPTDCVIIQWMESPLQEQAGTVMLQKTDTFYKDKLHV